MRPIVDGIKKKFSLCLSVQHVNYNSESRWVNLIGPLGTPEFALLDSKETILRRWVGWTEKEEFEAVLAPLCNG